MKPYERIKDNNLFYVGDFGGTKMLCNKDQEPLKNMNNVKDFSKRFKAVSNG